MGLNREMGQFLLSRFGSGGGLRVSGLSQVSPDTLYRAATQGLVEQTGSGRYPFLPFVRYDYYRLTKQGGEELTAYRKTMREEEAAAAERHRRLRAQAA